jgi:hypothetical protein
MSEKIVKVKDIKEGQFIRVVDSDKSGKFSHTGEVIKVSIKPPYFEMMTFDGVMGFDMDDSHKHELYESASKPKGWAAFKKNPKKYKEKIVEESKVEPVKTIKEQVFDLVKANPRKKKPSLLKLAKKEIGGPASKLQTYIDLALLKK